MIKKILGTLLLLTSVTLLAQRTTSSPYSYFGIGDQFATKTVEQNSMGGIGASFSHRRYLNFTNPAAIADLRFTTYSFGLLNTSLTVKDQSEKQTGNSTSLSYVGVGFPIGKKAGIAFGLQPVSSIGYGFFNTKFDDTGNPLQVSSFDGSGGINRLYGLFGIKLLKGLSVGLEADYRFGNVENSIIHQDSDVSLATKYIDKSILRGGSITLGTQYKKEFANQLILDFGAVVKLDNTIDVTGDSRTYTLSFSGSGVESPRDFFPTQQISGEYQMPLKTIYGMGLGKLDKWYAGVEYASQDAINNVGVLNSNEFYNYGESSRLSFGGFFIPKLNSISSYWERVTYRAGFRFEKTGLLVDGSGFGTEFTPIDDFGMSFGLGLPLGNRFSSINMAFEYGKRGTISNNLLQENYFNFRVSLSLTDVNWFKKRKID